MTPTNDTKPSIVELQHLEREMDRAPWVDVHPALVFQDGPDPIYPVNCRGSMPHTNASGIAALRNAAPVLLEIVAAALAYRRPIETEQDARDSLVARKALDAALAKVRP